MRVACFAKKFMVKAFTPAPCAICAALGLAFSALAGNVAIPDYAALGYPDENGDFVLTQEGRKIAEKTPILPEARFWGNVTVNLSNDSTNK